MVVRARACVKEIAVLMAETSKTVDHALRLLRELGGPAGAGSIAELTRRMGLSRTVVQRLLVTLQEHGFVHRDAGGEYALGMTILDLAIRVRTPLRRVAAALLAQLVAAVGETAVLTLRDGDEAVSADQVGAAGHIVRVEYPPGVRHPLTRAAAGRAILAFADERALRRALATVDDQDLLRRQLAECRERGYAVSVNELSTGAAGFAAPIVDQSGVAVASIGVILPVQRFPGPAQLPELVVRAGREASRALRDAG